MKLGEYIKNYRLSKNLSQRQFATQCGISNGYISMLEEGRNPRTNEPLIPSLPMLKKIASGIGISIHDLISAVDDMPISFNEEIDLPQNNNIIPLPKTKKIPLLGTVACGEPILAEQNIDGYFSAPTDLDVDFCLRAQGDSMINARIFDDDIVFVHQQPTVEDGEIAIILIDDEATIKRVYFDRENGFLTLVPENPQYKVMRFQGEKLNQIRILGKVIAGYYKIQK
ncbi:MAG: helix-turn-helix domain-containing protein [Clostridia bacterium]|nr:helix-turn-helix domain-containing protein [Clostridia bacterium]